MYRLYYLQAQHLLSTSTGLSGSLNPRNTFNMATFNEVSADIVFQILSLLPVLFVLRCKSVCKQWLSIISDPRFTRAHLTISQKKPSVLIGSAFSNYGFWLISSAFRYYVDLYVPPRLAGNLEDYEFTSCDGLVCLSNIHCNDIFLWNPATRQCYKIRPSPGIRQFDDMFILQKPSVVFYYDPICNDYKILRIMFRDCPVRVDLYSKNSGNWREVEVTKEEARFISCCRPSKMICGMVVNRVLYINSEDELISFQLCDEKFKVVPLPSIKLQKDAKPSRSRIFNYEGCVGLILYCHGDESQSLWTLDEDDESGSVFWTKNFNLDASVRVESRTIYLGDGKFLTCENSTSVILYDHKKKEIKKFQQPTLSVPWRKNFNSDASVRAESRTIYLGDVRSVTCENSRSVILYDHEKKRIKKFHHRTCWYFKLPHNYTESLVSVKGL